MYWERWFSLYDLKTLLDYITNLQEEVNKLTAESTEWESKCYDLQEENEILRELNVCVGCNLNYKQRNEKAIEILEQDKSSASFNTAERIALNILKGDE